MKTQLKLALLCIVSVLFLTGCQSFKNGKSGWNPVPGFLQKKEAEDEFGEPVRMQAIWKEAVYEKPGSKATKGFGARIFFYDAEGKPVKADGKLIVYGFDDSREKTSSAPDRKYEYERAEFQNHYSENELGHSYSIWLPWEKIGGVRKEVSLYPVFKTSSGKVLENKIALAVLPGKKPPEQTISKMGRKSTLESNDSNVRMASFDGDEASGVAHASGSVTPKRKSRATTIRVTRSLSNHMKSLAPQDLHVKETSTPAVRQENAPREKRGSAADPEGEPRGPKTGFHPSTKPVFGQPGSFN